MRTRRFAAAVLLPVLTACAGEVDPGSEAPPVAEVADPAPTPSDLILSGLQGLPDAVTLTDGVWQDTTTRTSVVLATEFRLQGDLDGSGDPEEVVLVETSFGGTGHFQYLVVVPAGTGEARTQALLGDRVQVVDGHVVDGQVVLTLVEHGPEDAMCCPRVVTVRRYALEGDSLARTGQTEVGPRTLALLESDEWTLDAWGSDDPVDPATPEITLRYQDGALSGSSGCNSYQGELTESSEGIQVGPLASTLRACAAPVDQVERRFLERLQGVNGYSFVAGRLVLTWETGDAFGTLFFHR